MKKFHYLPIVILVFAFLMSCSKDDEDMDVSFQGTWKLTSFELKVPLDLNNDGISNTSFEPGCLNGSELKIMDNANGTIFLSADVTYNTSNDAGDLFYMTACSTNSERVPTPITYNLSSETITNSETGESFDFTLENNTLSILIPNGFVASDVDTFETSVSQDIIYIFTKQ